MPAVAAYVAKVVIDVGDGAEQGKGGEPEPKLAEESEVKWVVRSEGGQGEEEILRPLVRATQPEQRQRPGREARRDFCADDWLGRGRTHRVVRSAAAGSPKIKTVSPSL